MVLDTVPYGHNNDNLSMSLSDFINATPRSNIHNLHHDSILNDSLTSPASGHDFGNRELNPYDFGRNSSVTKSVTGLLGEQEINSNSSRFHA